MCIFTPRLAPADRALAAARGTEGPLLNPISRRCALGMAVAGALPLGPMSAAQASAAIRVQVWKSAGGRCCDRWAAYMRAAGFDPMVLDVVDLDLVKASLGIPASLQSCHTALVGRYVLEGHVPADDVRRLLAKRSQARGLAVPGLEPSSPGMDQPGTPYRVVLFGGAKGDSVWRWH